MADVGVFYGHLVYFVAIYVVYFFALWYISCTKKNLATLVAQLKSLQIAAQC
jgi:hypothetical protein